jgi:hypothetical protein
VLDARVNPSGIRWKAVRNADAEKQTENAQPLPQLRMSAFLTKLK